jgi:hypothetical protein
MNKLRNLVGLVAVCAAAFFTGCGDDTVTGEGNTNNNGGNNTTSNAPQSLNGQSYTLTDANGTSTLAFDASGNSYTVTPGDTNIVAETGTFTATQSGDVWTVTALNDAGGTNSTIALTFTGNGVGTYTIQRPGSDQVSGSFAASSGTHEPEPNPNPNPEPNPNPTGTVQAPATLQSITVTTTQSGIGPNSVYTVTLSGGASGTFTARNTDNNVTGTGTYTYTPQGTQAHLRLDYAEFAGDFDDMTLVFTTQPGGGVNQFTGTQKVGGSDYTFTGTFTY